MIRHTQVELRSLTTGYVTGRRATAVSHGLDASLRSCELTCLLGVNGAGKSTLLRTIAGFQHPLHGQVLISGRDITTIPPSERARMLSVVLTARPSQPYMTARSLVETGRSPYTGFWGRTTLADRQAVDDAIRLTAIEHLAPRDITSLSDGELQKVMIAKALVQQTPVLILDEPTAFLDFESKVALMRLLHRLSRQRRMAILMSTHELDLALQTADRLWLLDPRHGLRQGTPEDLAWQGELSRYFDGESARFDKRACRFAITVKRKGCICVEGPDCDVRELVCKALMRVGYAICEDPTALRVQVTDEGIVVSGRRAASIGEMLDMVNRIGVIVDEGKCECAPSEHTPRL